MRLSIWLALLAVFAATSARAADWPTFGANPARTGSVSGEQTLSASTVARLHLRWRTTLGDVADSAPIFLSHVKARGRTLAMLFITAKNGTTYGIDASDGRIAWHFETHGPGITTSVPVADPSGTSIYAPGVDGFVHKLAAANGDEERTGGFPVRITRMPDTEKDASSLNLANGYLYAATSGYFGDGPPYVGHVVAIRLSDGSSHVFNSLCSNDRSLPAPTSCSHSDSGIWSRGGVVVDPDASAHGRVYAATGNGNFSADSGGHDYGDSVIALAADGARLVDSYTPSGYAQLDSEDADLGSSSPALLPRQPHSRTPLLAVQGGKDGILRLLDRDRLGGVGGELQRLDIGTGLFSTPAVWDDGGRTRIFLGLPAGVRAYGVTTDARGATKLFSAWSAPAGRTGEGTTPILCNGVVFVAMDGAIYALDARTGKELWNSARPGAGGSIGGIHWESPIAVNGWVYCADQDGRLTAYSVR